MRDSIRCWGVRRWSWRGRAGWTTRPRRRWRTPSLLIYHAYSSRRSKAESPAGNPGVQLGLRENQHAFLSRRLHNVQPRHQPRARDGEVRRRIGLIGLDRLEVDHVRDACGRRIRTEEAGMIPFFRVFDELADEVGTRAPVRGERRADDLTRRRAGCVDPEIR